MRLAYIDEAGFTDWKYSNSPYVVVGGVIVHGDHQLAKTEAALEAAVARHIPEKDRAAFVLHSGDIYGGYGKYFDKRKHPEWADTQRRWAILDDLAKIPESANLRAFYGAVKQSEWQKPRFTYGLGEKPNLMVEMHVTAYVVCAMQIELWHRQYAKAEHCMVVVENNQDSKTLISSTQRYYQDKAVAEVMTAEQRAFFPLRKIKEDPAFQTKRAHNPLVLADFIAFTVKRKLMKDPHIDRFCKPWWHRSVGLEIKHPLEQEWANDPTAPTVSGNA
ncbi:MAG: DUF3800 domain-containing protein [Betaproteobacteria bacterium]